MILSMCLLERFWLQNEKQIGGEQEWRHRNQFGGCFCSPQERWQWHDSRLLPVGMERSGWIPVIFWREKLTELKDWLEEEGEIGNDSWVSGLSNWVHSSTTHWDREHRWSRYFVNGNGYRGKMMVKFRTQWVWEAWWTCTWVLGSNP